MGLFLFKKTSTPLLVIVVLFFINTSIPSLLIASTPKTKDLTQKITKNPLQNATIFFSTKALFWPRLSEQDIYSEQKYPPQHVIDGLVLNNTLSREGYDFYIMFTHYWTPPVNAVNFQIIVKEYNRAGRSTILAISLNDKELVYRVVTPTYSALDGLASAAANHLSTYLKNGNHLNGLETKSNLKDSKSNSKRITSPFDVNVN